MNLKETKLIVLMAAYNSERWIKEQINSIKKQDNLLKVFLTISIDKSTDNTKRICKEISLDDINIKLLDNEYRFGSAAPNFFYLLENENFDDYDYIAFSDHDDIWYQNKLTRSIEMLEHYQCDGYSSNVTAFWPDGRQKLIEKAQPQVEWDFLFESPGPGCTFVLTRRLALELQAFIRVNKEVMRSVWLHDWFTYAFARSHGYKWHIDKHSSMLYRQHSTNQVGVNTGYSAFIHRARFVLSGKALKQSTLIARLCGLESHPFVKPWLNLSHWGMLYLAINANKCRRKTSEKIIFMFSCFLLAIMGHKKP